MGGGSGVGDVDCVLHAWVEEAAFGVAEGVACLLAEGRGAGEVELLERDFAFVHEVEVDAVLGGLAADPGDGAGDLLCSGDGREEGEDEEGFLHGVSIGIFGGGGGMKGRGKDQRRFFALGGG